MLLKQYYILGDNTLQNRIPLPHSHFSEVKSKIHDAMVVAPAVTAVRTTMLCVCVILTHYDRMG